MPSAFCLTSSNSRYAPPNKMARISSPTIWVAVISFLFPTIAFVLVAIALFAGTGPQQQQLEEYHILSVGCLPGHRSR